MNCEAWRARVPRDQRGASAVEFALVLPILLTLVFGVIQYGFYFYSMQSGTLAVQQAVRRMSVGDCQSAAEVKTYLYARLGSATTAPAATSLTPTISYTKADGTTPTTAPGEIGGNVTVSLTYPSNNFRFPLVPVPRGGDVTRTAQARIEDLASTGCS